MLTAARARVELAPRPAATGAAPSDAPTSAPGGDGRRGRRPGGAGPHATRRDGSHRRPAGVVAGHRRIGLRLEPGEERLDEALVELGPAASSSRRSASRTSSPLRYGREVVIAENVSRRRGSARAAGCPRRRGRGGTVPVTALVVVADAGADESMSGTSRTIMSPSATCCLTTSYSSSVSLPGLRRTWSGMPILPTSWSSPASRIVPSSSSGSRGAGRGTSRSGRRPRSGAWCSGPWCRRRGSGPGTRRTCGTGDGPASNPAAGPHRRRSPSPPGA